MSIRTAEPGSAEADEPERSTDVVTEKLASPSPLPAPTPVDVGAELLPEPVRAAPLEPEPVQAVPLAVETSAPAISSTDTDAGQVGSDVVVASSGDVAVPESLQSPLVPVPAQDLAPAAPATSDVATTSSSIAAPTPLGAEHDDTALETSAGGAGSGSGSADVPTDGKGGGRRPKKDPEGRMALREHLAELRKRVVRAGIAILAGAIGGWLLYPPFIAYITKPLQALRAADGTKLVSFNFNNIAASFDLQLKGAVWIGFVISSPFWIYQLWAFITPGLTKKERRYAVGFVSAAVPLFLAGVYLASLFVPRAVAFFVSFTPDGGSNITDASSYIGFVMRTVLTFGLAFLLPVVLVALNFTGLLPGKAILRAWRWVLVAALTFAAVANPTPDLTTMFALAAPIIILFAVAIAIALVHDKRKAKRSPSYAGVDDDQASDLSDDEAAPL